MEPREASPVEFSHGMQPALDGGGTGAHRQRQDRIGH